MLVVNETGCQFLCAPLKQLISQYAQPENGGGFGSQDLFPESYGNRARRDGGIYFFFREIAFRAGQQCRRWKQSPLFVEQAGLFAPVFESQIRIHVVRQKERMSGGELDIGGTGNHGGVVGAESR